MNAIAPALGPHVHAASTFASDRALVPFVSVDAMMRLVHRVGLATMLREIAGVHRGEFILTPNHNLVIAAIKPEDKPEIEALLARHALDGGVSALRRNAMACVALPTCGLALAESER